MRENAICHDYHRSSAVGTPRYLLETSLAKPVHITDVELVTTKNKCHRSSWTWP